jgi:hypothetical protein
MFWYDALDRLHFVPSLPLQATDIYVFDMAPLLAGFVNDLARLYYLLTSRINLSIR